MRVFLVEDDVDDNGVGGDNMKEGMGAPGRVDGRVSGQQLVQLTQSLPQLVRPPCHYQCSFFSKSNDPMLIFLDATVGAVPGSKSQNVNHILMVDITYTRYT